MSHGITSEHYTLVQEVISLPLIDVHYRIARWPDPLAAVALEMLVEHVRENPDRLTGEDPDSMHNLVMHAARVRRSDIQECLLLIFATACPEDVDLQADLLQYYFTKRWDPEACERQWKLLNDDEIIPPTVRRFHWRYWVFGALYFARMKRDVSGAQDLIRQGLEAVVGRSKSDILRNFEDVFIDLTPIPQIKEVVDALRKGIEDGWPLGYTLALNLAILLQRQAFASGDAKSGENPSRLREALKWLSVAESLFTNDPNHPITDIYRARINILMGLENYREAIDYIEAVYSQDPEAAQRDPSLRAQLILACRRAGEADLWRKIMSGQEEEQDLVRAAKPQERPDDGKANHEYE